jgi:hypothetical protein
MSSLILRSKNANSAFDIKGLRLKQLVVNENTSIEEKIELELNDDALKKKKVVKKIK